MADNPTLKIDINADVAGEQQVKQLATDMSALDTETKQAATSADQYGTALAGQAQIIRQLQSELQALRADMAALNTETKQVAVSSDQYGNAIVGQSNDLRLLMAEMKDMLTAMSALNAETKQASATSDQHRKAMDGQTDEVRLLQSELKAMRAEMSALAATKVSTTESVAALTRLKIIAGESRGDLYNLLEELKALAAEQKAVQSLGRLEVQLKNLETQLARSQAEINQLGDAMQAEGADVDALARKLDTAEANYRSTGIAIEAVSNKMAELRTQYNITGQGTESIARANAELGVKFTEAKNRADEFVKKLYETKVAQEQAGGVYGDLKRKIDDSTHSITGQISALGGMGNRITEVRNALVGFFGIYELAGYINETRKLAEEWDNLESRLKLVTKSEAELTDVRAKLIQSSKDTYTSLADNIGLYVKAKDALQNLNVSNDRVIGLTQTWNQALQLNGSSTAAAAGSTLQLTQALGAGAIRGEEFNSMVEGNSYFMQRLAKAILGEDGTIGALKKFASEGKLTSAVFLEATEKISAGVDKDFGNVEINITRAMTNLKTSFQEYIGSTGGVSAANTAIAGGINLLAGNIDTFIASVTALAGAWGALKLAGLIKDLYAAGAAAAVVTKEFYATAAAAKVTATSMASLGTAGKLALAGLASYEIGSFLRDQFVIVEIYGDRLAEGFTIIAATAQAAFDILRSPLDAGQIWDDYINELDKIQTIYDDMVDQAWHRSDEEVKAVGAATKAVEDGAAKSVEANAKAADSVAKVAQATMSVEDAAKTLGVTIGGAMGQAAEESAKVVGAFASIATSGKATGDVLTQSLIAAIGKLTNTDAPAMQKALDDAFKAGKISAEQFTQSSALLSQSFGTVNNSAQVVRASLVQAFDDGKISVLQYQQGLAALDGTHAQTSRVLDGIGNTLLAAWKTGAISANTYNDVISFVNDGTFTAGQSADSMRVILEQLFKGGIIGGGQYKELLAQIDALQGKSSQSADALSQAMSSMGLQSSSALQQAADKSQVLFNQVQALGGTAHDVEQAFLSYAEAQLKATQAMGKTVDSTLVQKAATLGLKSEVIDLAQKYGVAGQYTNGHSQSLYDNAKQSDNASKSTKELLKALEEASKKSKETKGSMDSLSNSYYANAKAAKAAADAAAAAARVRDSAGYTQADRANGLGATSAITISAETTAVRDAAIKGGASAAAIDALARKVFNDLVQKGTSFTAEKYNQLLADAIKNKFGGRTPQSDPFLSQNISSSVSTGYAVGGFKLPTSNTMRSVDINIKTASGTATVSADAANADKLVNLLKESDMTL